MTEHKEVSAWLASMELDVSDPKKLFNLRSTTFLVVTIQFRDVIPERNRLVQS